MTATDPALSKAAARIYVAVFLLAAGIYLATLTSDYYPDGITFALQIEEVARGQRDAGALFHQNHLLYSALGYLLYHLVHAAGFSIRALNLLQITNALLGAAAVAIVCRIAHRSTGSLAASIAGAAMVAFSAVWWKLSTDADAYMLSVLLMLLLLSHLLSSRPGWPVAGLLLAGAMLIHELAALFFLPALAAVGQSSTISRKGRFAAGMSLTAWGVAVVAYALVAPLSQGVHGPAGVIRWALSTQSGVTAAFNPLPGLLLIPRSNFDLFVGHNLAFLRRHGAGTGLLIAFPALASALGLATTLLFGIRDRRFARALSEIRKRHNEKWPLPGPTLLLWVGAYLLFLVFWEPWQVYYRVFYVPAIGLALCVVLARSQAGTSAILFRLGCLAILTVGFGNLALFILPGMRKDANPLIAAAVAVKWDERTVVYYAGRDEANTAFQYFNPASQWRRLNSGSLDALESDLASAYHQGGSVWLSRKASRMVDGAWLASHASGRQIKVDAPESEATYTEILPY